MSVTALHEQLATVDPRAVAAYLTLNGWERTHRGELGDRWRSINGGQARNLAIPHALLDRSDRATMMSKAVQVLHEVEARPWHRIAADLRDADSDVVRFRVVAPRLADGELPLTSAPEMLSGALEALKSAARAENQRRAFYSGGQLPIIVAEFLENARLAPAEKGSVILNIRSRVEPTTAAEAQTSLIPEADRPSTEIPFARRALRRLVSGVKAAKTAAHREALALATPEAFDDDIEEGLSANLCDALADLAVAKSSNEIDARITLGVRWSLFFPSDEAETSVDVTTPELRTMTEIAERLRNIRPLVDQHLTGFVRELNREPGDGDGSVRVLADVQGQAAVVRVHLASHDYNTALRAHEANHELSFSGTLEKAGKIWEVVSPTSVQVVAP